MRRPLTYVAVALILLGSEVAAGAVSTAGARLWAGLGAAFTGDDYMIPAIRSFAGTAILLGGVALLGTVLWAETHRRAIVAEGEHCPQCGTATKRVRRRKRHRVLSRILETNVTRRRCERCGWKGLTS